MLVGEDPLLLLLAPAPPMKEETEELKGAYIPPATPPLLFVFILFTIFF